MKTSTVTESHIIFDYGKKKIPFEQITYFKSEFGNYTKVCLKERKGFLSAFTLKHYSQKLSDKATFMVPRKGLIVNKAHVKGLDQNKGSVYIELLSGEKFKVSRRRTESVLREFTVLNAY